MRRLVVSLLLPAAAGAARNLTFLHIPKTAGATIEELGGPAGPFRKHKCGRANVTFKREHCDMWHVPPRDLLAGREAWYPRDSTFCVVRDPVARLLSEFKFLHRQKPAQLNDAAFASDCRISESIGGACRHSGCAATDVLRARLRADSTSFTSTVSAVSASGVPSDTEPAAPIVPMRWKRAGVAASPRKSEMSRASF